MPNENLKIVGKVTRRKDGVARVTGEEVYTTDVVIPHMMYGRTVASPYAHARIKRIDTSKAEAMGAVVITFDDIPHVRYNERIVTVPWKLHKDHYVLADKVRRWGEAVAAVAADTEELAEKAARAVEVEYEVLPVVLDPLEAMKPGTPAIYDHVVYGDEEISIENNIALERNIEEGDVDKAFAEADEFVEGTFDLHKIYHAHMETKSAVCKPEPDGGLTVYTTTQSIHNVRIILGNVFDIPLSKINVKRIALGGSFGSSIQMNSVTPICAALALKARRPVKMLNTREEDMYDHSKYPLHAHVQIAAKKDGTLLGAKMEVVADLGAHIVQGYSYLGVCIGWLVSLYKLPNIRYHGVGVYTNKPPSCAMQGYGNPQVTFVGETLMDMLADKLGMDPIELRLKNYVGKGDTFWGQGPAVRSIIRSDGVKELLTQGAKLIGWENRTDPSTKTGRYRRGIGIGRGFHTSSAGAPQPGDVIDYSGAMVKINQDGSVDVISAVMDHGGGTHEAMAKLVAETLCIPLDKVTIVPADTGTTVYDVVTHATRGVYAGCGAATRVAKKVKQELIETAAVFMNVYPDGIEMRMDEELGQGVLFVPGLPDKVMTVRDVATKCWTDSMKTIAAVDSYRPIACPPCFVSVFTEVEVDTWTGNVRIVRGYMGGDAGTIINPDMVRGQLEGGFQRGSGYAMYEDGEFDPTGRLKSKGFWIDSKVPGAVEIPKLEDFDVYFVETYEPTGPFGAKGIGEAAMNPVAAAFASAITNATGIRFFELPITPEKILAALKAQAENKQSETAKSLQEH